MYGSEEHGLSNLGYHTSRNFVINTGHLMLSGSYDGLMGEL
jgi:hypothetical protein